MIGFPLNINIITEIFIFVKYLFYLSLLKEEVFFLPVNKNIITEISEKVKYLIYSSHSISTGLGKIT